MYHERCPTPLTYYLIESELNQPHQLSVQHLESNDKVLTLGVGILLEQPTYSQVIGVSILHSNNLGSGMFQQLSEIASGT